MKKIFLLCTSLFVFSVISYAASEENIRIAFQKSYLAEKDGKYSDGISILKKVYSDNDYELNMRLGWMSYLGGFFNESSAYYQKSINLRKYSIEAKLGKAYPLSALGNWTEIENLYNEILKIDPANTLVNYRLGSIYYGRKNYKTAEKYLEKVLNLYPMDYNTLILMGWVKVQLGKKKEATILFNKTLRVSPGDTSALDGLKASN